MLAEFLSKQGEWTQVMPGARACLFSLCERSFPLPLRLEPLHFEDVYKRQAHAVAHAMKIAPTMEKDKIIVITISGRGDKDCAAIARYRGEDIHE